MSNYKLKRTFPPAPSTTRGQPCVIGVHPKDNKIVYCSARSVVIRSVTDPTDCFVYTEHTHPTTVAKFAPSGAYVASGDSTGKMRVWDILGEDNVLKIELPVLGGPIHDLAWTGDSQRLIVVGEGNDAFARAILLSGSSCGSITGHTKTITSVDIKADRPIRAATGSLDAAVGFYPGVPFKFQGMAKDHDRFVNCVRFSPNGEHFVSASSDKKMIIYSGKDGSKVGELPVEHKGGIFAVSWSPDSKKLLSASADKTAKLWDMDSKKCLTTFNFAEKPDTLDQQLGCAIVGDKKIAVSLDGVLSFLDESSPAKPVETWHGHSAFIQSIAYDVAGKKLYSGDHGASGKVICWDLETGKSSKVGGQQHTGHIVTLAIANGTLYSAGTDDAVRSASLSDNQFNKSAGVEGAPADLAVHSNGLGVIVTHKGMQVLKSGAVVKSIPIDYEATAVAISPDGNTVAVGSDESVRTHVASHTIHTLHIYSLSSDGSMSETKKLEKHKGAITAIKFSPDGKWIASACKKNDIFLWDAKSYECKVSDWCFHSATVNSVNWSPNSKRLVSAGRDSQVIVWNVEKPAPSERIAIKRAHPLGVNDAVFIDDNTIVSGGLDNTLRMWTF